MALTRRQLQLIEQWKPLVDDLKTDRDRAICAQVLQNQENYFRGALPDEDEMKELAQLSESGTASIPLNATLTGIARYRKIIIPMVRRTFPNLVANEVVGVQPMTGPVGLAYALRFIYATTYGGITAGQEAGHNTISRSYTGPHILGVAERLDAPRMEGGSTGQMVEMNLLVEKQTIKAKSRKLKSRWSLEAEQDLKNMHDVNIRDEAVDILSYQLSAEIDREVLWYLQNMAMAGGVYNWTYTQGGGAGADGRWEQEIFRTFYTKLLKASNDIARATRRGAGNFVIASADVCAMLESLAEFNSSPVSETIDSSQVGVANVGKIGHFTVYRDLFATTNYAIVGYKGPGDTDAGLIFCPYVPIMFSEATGEENFQPRIGVMTRYAIADNLFGAQNYYRYISVSGLGDAMGSWTAGVSGTTAVQYTTAGEQFECGFNSSYIVD